jgi:hypothetical protein
LFPSETRFVAHFCFARKNKQSAHLLLRRRAKKRRREEEEEEEEFVFYENENARFESNLRSAVVAILWRFFVFFS